MTEIDITQYPPYKMTDAQIAATVGRYQEDQVAAPVPNLTVEAPELKAGRIPAAAPGVVYTGDVYDPPTSEAITPHEASVAAYPPKVRSSVPDAIDPATPGVEAARAALEPDAVAPTHLEIVAEATAAKAEDEATAADEAAVAADEAAADDAQLPELDEAAAAKAHDADQAATAADQAEAAVVAEVETGVDVDNAEPAHATPDYSEMNVSQLRAELGKKGVEYEYSARKADLVKLLEGSDNR